MSEVELIEVVTIVTVIFVIIGGAVLFYLAGE